MEENFQYFGESIGPNFLSSPNSKDFTALSYTMGNWWGNTCISHMMKYNIGWKSHEKKTLILWEKYEYQFPMFSHTMGFIAFFRAMGNWLETHAFSM